jgi:hypothetical protein
MSARAGFRGTVGLSLRRTDRSREARARTNDRRRPLKAAAIGDRRRPQRRDVNFSGVAMSALGARESRLGVKLGKAHGEQFLAAVPQKADVPLDLRERQRHSARKTHGARFDAQARGPVLRYSNAPEPLSRPSDDARQHAREWGALALRDLRALPPWCPDECGRVRRRNSDSRLWAAHGLHRLRDRRRGRAAELERTIGAKKPHRRTVALTSRTCRISWRP